MLRVSGRVRKILVAVLAGLVVIVAVALAILPEVVRRVAVDQVPKLTGRVLALDDVDLNLFTGHLALKGARIFKSGVNERAVEFERLDVRLDYLPFLLHKVRVTEISLVGAKMSILRRGSTEFDFADVLGRLKGGTVRGGGALNGLEGVQTGCTDPFLTVPGLSVKINDADLVARSDRLLPGNARASTDAAAEGRVELTITN